jgi:thioesterase domain-containing protein
MARQLIDQGKEVGTLAILDTPGLGQKEELDGSLDDTRLLAHIVTQIESHFESHLGITYEDLVVLDEESQYNLIIERMKENSILPEDGSQKQLTGLVRVFKMNSQAMDIYRPKMYAGDITVFATKSLCDRFPSDDSLRWGEVTTGEVRVVAIPGDHSSFLKSPYVEVFAEELEKWLEMIR